MSDKLLSTFEGTALEEFKTYCRLDPTQEQCGLFVETRDGSIGFVPCENIAYDKKNSFLVHPKQFIDAGLVLAVGHSHVVGTSQPSNEDMVNSNNCQLPFIIFQPEANTLDVYEPTQFVMPFEGRSWTLGVSDCYTLACDYYKQHGIVLPEYVRNDLSVLFKHSLFVEHYAEHDFVKVQDGPKEHDALLIQISSDVPNHVAIMVDNGLILHHIQRRLSCKEPYGGYWRRHTAMILRHKKWL